MAPQNLFSNRYHRYVMCAERAMYAAPELKAVICNAEMIKQEIIADFGVPADKITVIYSAIDNQFPPADEAQRRLREQYQITTGALLDLRRLRFQGLAAAIRAVAATDSHLTVVGKDKDEKRYRALAQSLGCSDRVHFMGVQKQTLPFYQAADAAAADAVRSVPECDSGSDVVRSAGYHQHHLRRRRVYHPSQNGFVTDARRTGHHGGHSGAAARRWDHPWAKRRDCAL